MRKLPFSQAPVNPTPTPLIRLQRHVLRTCRPRRTSTPATSQSSRPFFTSKTKSLAQLRPEPLSEFWFTSSSVPYPYHPPSAPEAAEPASSQPTHRAESSPPPLLHEQETPDPSSPPTPPEQRNKDHQTPSERTIALGDTLRELSPLLPTLLLHPLPPHLLSPQITLHLFPSTHPHLPVVKGKVAYRAALWTAPVAWGRIPLIGDVKLEILSERVVRTGWCAGDSDQDASDEKLVVRWRTEPSSSSTPSSSDSTTTSPAASSPTSGTTPTPTASASSSSDPTNRGLSTLLGGDQPLLRLPKDPAPGQFSGLFIFGFDEKGKIVSHTIEHADESSGYDRTAKVVSLTDWLLGKAKERSRSKGEGLPELAYMDTGEWEGMNRAGRTQLTGVWELARDAG